jgi:hypothetical protein
MRFLFALLIGTVTAVGLHAQLDPSQPEKTELATGATPGTYTFSWNGQPNRTYFIQQSDDLATWVYLPIIERGDGQTLSYGLSSNAARIFWRLRFSPLATYSDDVDNDGLNDADELALGRDPFKADALATGLPDGWAVAYVGKLSVYPQQIRLTLAPGQTGTAQLYISNDTATPVDFQITVAGQQNSVANTYSATDSITGQAVYTWTDISTTGTKLTTISSADDASEAIPLAQFSFPFFGQSQSEIYASSNGLLSFGSAYSSYINLPVLSAGNGVPIIAGFWDDLYPIIQGDVYYLEQSDRLIVQYDHVSIGNETDTVTFQIILHADGKIDLFYKELTGSALSATVGIANSYGTGQGLQIAHEQAYIASVLAVKIAPAAVSSLIEPVLQSGTLPAHSVLKVDVLLNAVNSLTTGLHNATLGVTFNRANTPVWTVPVTLKIPGSGQPVITLVEPACARLLD